MKKAKSTALLFLAACIWGVAFVAQSVGLNYVGPMTLNGSRFLLGGTVLLPLLLYQRKKRKGRQRESRAEAKGRRRTELIGGVCCGLALCLSSCLQQYGLLYTTVGKAGFITTLYIVIVPLVGGLMGKKVGKQIWLGVLAATIGFYLLCITDGSRVNRGDLLIFLCAISFSFHILIIDHFASRIEGVRLSCIQFYVSGIFCTVAAILLEEPSWSEIVAGAVPILYAGVLSCGVAYTLQIIAQKDMDPALASMILSLESVISVLAGWLILKERLTGRQLVGCILVFAAVLLAQLPRQKGEKIADRE